jgi:hypothetical protein
VCSSDLSMIARSRAVRSGVASEVAQQMITSASRIGAGPDLRPDLEIDAMEFTTASAAP